MSKWPLGKKRIKIYTGDIIEGCKEWYWYYPEKDVKEFIRLLKCYNKNKLMGKDFILISIKVLDKLAGDELL